MISSEAVAAAAAALHELDCDDPEPCARWACGTDPSCRFYASHVPHVNYYHDRARAVLKAAEDAT